MSGRGSLDWALRLACGRRRCAGGFFVKRDLAHEAVAIGGDEVEHQPRRRAVRRIDDEGLVDPHRLGQVEAPSASRPA